MKKAIIPIVAVLALAAAAWSFGPSLKHKSDPRTGKFVEDSDSLILGLQQYKEFMGSYPNGTLVDISRALSGQSTQGEKRVVILVARKSELNTKGEIVDAWGTPIQIFYSQNGILIRSAGPNKVFEDSKSATSDDLFRSS
ncbi:MAG: hypothetical protein ABIV39_07750 [Verrucomicrobiota bacterium]